MVGGLHWRVSPWDGPETDRAPLVLCNGIGAGLELWGPLRRALRPLGVPTIAFDAPGVGGSEVPAYPPTLRSLARQVAEMLDRQNVGQFDVLGVSWGGMLAQEVARLCPGRARRLVLAATVTGWTAIPGNPLALAALATPLRWWMPDAFTRFAPYVYGGDARSRQDRHVRAADPDAAAFGEAEGRGRAVSSRGYAWQILAARGWTSLGWLHRLPQPTLVLAGNDDPLVPMANARQMTRRIPDARLHVVDGGGHLFVVSRATEIAPVLAEFLQGEA